MPIDKLMSQANSNPALTGLLGGAAGGALISAFTNKKTAGRLLKAGGLVAAGGLAWKAYQSYKSDAPTNEAAPPAALSRQEFVQAIEDDGTNVIMIRAMIAAAHADGHLSEAEREKIWKAALDNGASSADLARLADEIANPLGVEQLAAAVATMEERIDLYTVSLLIIDDTCPAGVAWLDALAQALALPKPLATALQQQTSESALA